ncbi:hypothetical protein Tco_0788671 [Tanacetum coccineum]
MDPINCFCGYQNNLTSMDSHYYSESSGFHCCETVNPCRYFWWVDPAMCARSTVIIPGLLRNINNLQAEAIENARKARRMKMLLCFTDTCEALGVAVDLCDDLGLVANLLCDAL